MSDAGTSDTEPPRPRRIWSVVLDVVAAPAVRQALTVVVFVMALVAPFLRVFLGWPGMLGALAVVTAAAAVSLAARRRELEWRGILPISLLAFCVWITISVFWSEYTWASVGGILYSLTWAFLGAFVALSRDLIQVVRALGDAYERHEAMVGGIRLTVSWRELVASARANLIRTRESCPGDEGLGSALDFLDELSVGSPPPAVRYIDTGGVLHESAVACE